MEDKKAKVHMGEMVYHPWQFELLIKETDKLMNELKQQPKHIPDEDYCPADSLAGCIIAALVCAVVMVLLCLLLIFI